MIIVGIDPGSTTGIVVLSWAYELPAVAHESEILDRVHVEGVAETEDAIEEAVAGAHIVAVERFVFGPGSKNMSRQYEALYMYGVARHQARRQEAEFVAQQPSAAKTAYTDARLRELGWGEVRNRHERDALRHALLYTHSHRPA